MQFLVPTASAFYVNVSPKIAKSTTKICTNYNMPSQKWKHQKDINDKNKVIKITERRH